MIKLQPRLLKEASTLGKLRNNFAIKLLQLENKKQLSEVNSEILAELFNKSIDEAWRAGNQQGRGL